MTKEEKGTKDERKGNEGRGIHCTKDEIRKMRDKEGIRY
jgi:hypothetical protein